MAQREGKKERDDKQSTLIEHRLKLDEIAVYIKDRKIPELKTLFPTERHDTIYYMFYFYDEKGKRREGDEKIVFQDDEYIVIRSTKAYNTYRSSYYHGINIIGIDQNMPWVHRLPWFDDFEKENIVWSKKRIRQYMGYLNEGTRIKLGETTRVQGDLTIRLLENLSDDYTHNYEEKQLNVRLANHLIVIANAFEQNRNQFVVPRLTRCLIIHDEHQNADFMLDAGVYQFNLLRRHVNG